jgi:hypothetical protein
VGRGRNPPPCGTKLMANATYHRHTTRDKETAYRTVINIWLRADKGNIDIARAIIKQNKFRQRLLNDAYGGAKENPLDMRIGLSLPHGLYYSLVGYERLHGRNFMTTKEEMVWFAKKFPQFVICERI